MMNNIIEQKRRAGTGSIGFNHFMRASRVVPASHFFVQNRPGAITLFQELDDGQVRTWHLEVVVRREHIVTPFVGLNSD